MAKASPSRPSKKGATQKPRPSAAKPKPVQAPPAAPAAQAPPKPEVTIFRTPEIDAKDPLASGASAPVQQIWLQTAGAARDTRKVVVDLIGEGRGIIAVPVAFDTEQDAMEAMTPALDVLVRHCAEATGASQRPVMVDLQELRERLKLDPAEDWLMQHLWFHNALSTRELLCMYVFSPAYLFEFAAAIGEKQHFDVAIAKQDPGFYELTPKAGGPDGGVIIWNWARAIADVIAGGHAWSYFGLLLALAPQVARQKKADKQQAKQAAAEQD
jgi:hypothetical protein